MNFDLSIYLSPEAWVTLLTLTFLEIVLGIDNLVFIAITTNRLPENKQHIGRRLGLSAALIMRCCLLCLISFIMSLTKPVFSIGAWDCSWRDLILIAGGIYLIYKGIIELKDKLALVEEKAEHGHSDAVLRKIGLLQAVVTIMIMDIVFSLDSVITACGLSGQLPVMIPAVIIAVSIMIIFADVISNFINKHAEMKILALTFITMIGVLLIIEGFEFTTGIELLGMGLENIMVYFAMIFAVILEVIQMRYNRNYEKMMDEVRAQQSAEKSITEDRLALDNESGSALSEE